MRPNYNCWDRWNAFTMYCSKYAMIEADEPHAYISSVRFPKTDLIRDNDPS